MDLLDKYHIGYHVEKTFSNGVRIGIVTKHKKLPDRKPKKQAWFPKTWSESDIRHAGEHVAGLKHNRHRTKDSILFGMWKGVRVGVILTYGKIGTIFPAYDQPRTKGIERNHQVI